MAQGLTIDKFQKALPIRLKGDVDAKIMDNINNLISNPIVREHYRENLISYTSILSDKRYNLEQYLNAVKYVSYKLFGGTNMQSYQKTFPLRYQRLVDKDTSRQDISAYVNAYNKTKLVNLILEQTLVPFYVLNTDSYQKALNVQIGLMTNAKSETVRMKAADSVMMHLRPPETQKIELDIAVKEDSTIQKLRESTLALVNQEHKMLASGQSTIKEIAHSKLLISSDIVEGEIVDE